MEFVSQVCVIILRKWSLDILEFVFTKNFSSIGLVDKAFGISGTALHQPVTLGRENTSQRDSEGSLEN